MRRYINDCNQEWGETTTKLKKERCTYPLHTTIIDNDYEWFKELLLDPNIDVNEQNVNGETAIFLCVKHNRSNFTELLLEMDCDVSICNNNGMSPLCLSMIYRHYNTTEFLVTYKGDIPYDVRDNISEPLLYAIKNKRWIFQFLVRYQGQQLLICSACLNAFSLEFHEIDTFLEQIIFDHRMNREDVRYVIKEIMFHSLKMPNATIFKFLWIKLPHYLIQEYCIPFLSWYHNLCRFKNSEYLECLRIILVSPGVLGFFERSKAPDIPPLAFRQMLEVFRQRNIKRHDRVSTILCYLKFAEVTMWDIKCAYDLFGFNAEFIVFVNSFKFHRFFLRYRAIFNLVNNLIFTLDRDPCLSLDKIKDLELITKRSYLKLINFLPDQVLSTNESIRAKKKILSKVPTLYEISKYHSQKCIQNFYKIQEGDEFCETVKNLNLPCIIKNSLCKNPPMYYVL